KKTITLVAEPFAPLTTADRDTLADEGGRLLRFLEPGAVTFAVRFA
ncbi:MAG: winged helix DNA-binding domain-containing protein, partial [Akkermansiaceae bacterium]|nr:winged helix DNA-binding domain-containing protein [Armatimonadota bacterium]